MDAPPGHERIESKGSGGTGEDGGQVPDGGYKQGERGEDYFIEESCFEEYYNRAMSGYVVLSEGHTHVMGQMYSLVVVNAERQQFVWKEGRRKEVHVIVPTACQLNIAPQYRPALRPRPILERREEEAERESMEEEGFHLAGDREVVSSSVGRVVAMSNCPMVADPRRRHYIWENNTRKKLSIRVRREDRLITEGMVEEEISKEECQEEDRIETEDKEEVEEERMEEEVDMEDITEGMEEENRQEVYEEEEKEEENRIETEDKEQVEEERRVEDEKEGTEDVEMKQDIMEGVEVREMKEESEEEEMKDREGKEKVEDERRKADAEDEEEEVEAGELEMGDQDEVFYARRLTLEEMKELMTSDENIVSSGDEYVPGKQDKMQMREEEDLEIEGEITERAGEENETREGAEREDEHQNLIRQRKALIRVFRGETKRNRHTCELEGCGAMVVNMPRHLKQVHGMEHHQKACIPEKGKRLYQGRKTCAVCGVNTIRMDLHLVRVDHVQKDGQDYNRLMREARTVTEGGSRSQLDEVLEEYGESMQGRSSGKARKPTTAQHHRTAVRTFLSDFTRKDIVSLMEIGEKGGVISQMLEQKNLTAVSIQVYLHAMVGFLDFVAGSPKWMRHVGLSVIKVKEISERVKNIAKSMKEDVNRENVERHAKGTSIPVEDWMLGAYLQGNRPVRLADLLDKAEVDGLSPCERTEVRDILVVILIIANARRPGDISHLLRSTIEDMEIPASDTEMIEFYITEHKEAKSGKFCPITLNKDVAILLKLYLDFIRVKEGDSPYFFLTRSGAAITPSNMSKVVSAEWTRFQKELGQDLPNLTASLSCKVAVTAVREAGGSREEQEVLARHMAHNVATADRYYDHALQKKERHKVINHLSSTYKAAAHKKV